MMMREGSSKKKGKSPNEGLLRSFYSKQKSKSQYSPVGNRSISKEQIKHQIKKVVYNTNRSQDRPPAFQEAHAAEERPGSSFRTSLTPKHFPQAKKQSQREVRTSKAGESRGKELFVTTGRYDLKHLFDRKKEQDSRSIQKRAPTTQPKCHEEETIKFNDRARDDANKLEKAREDGFNVRAYLTADEFAKFGERFPENFRRVGLLGRGGFSLVWLGVHRSSKRKVAIKQILTKNPHETHLKEIWFGSYFFEKGGEAREEFQHHVGINNLCRLYSHEIRAVDSWLFYEVCEESLGSSLFELKGESVNGERFYRMEHKELLGRMAQQPGELRVLVAEVCKALFLINSHNIVHSDLKTENILLRVRREESSRGPFIRGVKLIDFGSSFLFTNLKQFSMATPEYMPPEILNYILFQNKLDYDHQMLAKMERYKNPWTIDIWSLGCIVLEIVTGVPLWMSIETRIEGQEGLRVTGLFAVKNRVFSKIIQKQIEVVSNLDYHLDHHNHSRIALPPDLRAVLRRMLDLDPEKRISPFEVLAHLGVACQPLRIPSY